MPRCLPLRHGRVRWLGEEGADLGKTSKGWGFGCNLPLLRPGDGRVLKVLLTPGTWEDRAVALALVQGVDGGITRGDWGSRGNDCATELAEEAARLLLTRAQAPAHRFVLRQVRQQLEPTFSQLGWKFVDRVCSRSWLGLWNTLHLKVLCYNLRHARILSA